MNELPDPPAIEPVDPVPVDPIEPPAVDPVLEPVEPVLEPVEPVLDPVEPVPPVADPVEPVPPVLDPVDPVLEPVEPVEPVLEPVPIAPLPDPLDIVALVSMKPPLPEDELPVVPVAPVVPAPDALPPAPEPEIRQPVTTTLWPWLLLLLPVDDPPGVCAAAPAPSATAIIVPKRNCRFITSSVLGE